MLFLGRLRRLVWGLDMVLLLLLLLLVCGLMSLSRTREGVPSPM